MALTRAETLANPFVFGGALSNPSGYGFFGRGEVFDLVRSALNAVQRNPVILYGHRRIGKSSILQRLAQGLSPDNLCVYYNLETKGRISLDVVLYGLGRAICETLEADLPARADTTQETFHRVFLQRIASHLGSLRRLVLLLDEFDVIDQLRAEPEAAARTFVPYLASLLAAEPAIGVVMVVGRRTEELSDAFRAALLKNAVQMRIDRLAENQVAQMLDVLPVPTLAFDAGAVARVFALAAGHPYCTQVLCSTVWSRVAGRKTRVEAGDVDRLIYDAVQLGTNGMSWIFDGLELPEQRIFVSALSEVTDPVGGEAVSLVEVQSFLRERHLSLSQNELGAAAHDLLVWDVIEFEQQRRLSVRGTAARQLDPSRATPSATRARDSLCQSSRLVFFRACS